MATFLRHGVVPIAGLRTGKKKAKTAVLVAVEAKPEVEIWRRSKNRNSVDDFL